MDEPLLRLQNQLGYVFKDVALLERALTHRSKSKHNNERLEFLGDALLETILSDILFHLREEANEGDLTRLRATMVKGTTLAVLANELNLKDYMRMGSGELRTGGYRRESTLADAFEAVIAAVYLDSHCFDSTFAVVSNLYKKQLATLPDAEQLKDPKTCLQEWLQAKGMEKPVYRLVQVSGPDHDKFFEVACSLEDRQSVATGSSKKKAEQSSARAMLTQLNNQ